MIEPPLDTSKHEAGNKKKGGFVMEYNEVGQVVARAIQRYREYHWGQRECPTCKAVTTMVKVITESMVDEGDIHSELDAKWRCMNCLGLFKETLTKATLDTPSSPV